jgi:hypothetical protein
MSQWQLPWRLYSIWAFLLRPKRGTNSQTLRLIRSSFPMALACASHVRRLLLPSAGAPARFFHLQPYQGILLSAVFFSRSSIDDWRLVFARSQGRRGGFLEWGREGSGYARREGWGGGRRRPTPQEGRRPLEECASSTSQAFLCEFFGLVLEFRRSFDWYFAILVPRFSGIWWCRGNVWLGFLMLGYSHWINLIVLDFLHRRTYLSVLIRYLL